jgi:tetratricopeptide (TPR) repeat protein
VEKNTFLLLLRNFTSLTAEEARSLVNLQDRFPYSQVLHNMAARAAQDNQLDSREHLLHLSAIYTTDRSVLKSVMTAPVAKRESATPVEGPAKAAAVKVPVPKAEAPASFPLESEVNLSGEALRKDILTEINKLKISKHNFEVSVEEFDKANLAFHRKQQKEGKKTTRKTEPADALIEEIKTTKKKVNPEGKQKEQIEIIENFIKTKPKIPKAKNSAAVENPDLAAQSGSYGDNIVSETLVEILLKQGKKDKAIEVLRKLIWKFPQKKTYFAAKIEELKK